MALSNIRREPRREITESAIGIVALVLFLWGDYRFSAWFYLFTGGAAHNGCPWQVGMFLGPLFIVVLVLVGLGLAYGTHALGELICDAFADGGLELRPKQRYP
jgi:hypothetical protein